MYTECGLLHVTFMLKKTSGIFCHSVTQFLFQEDISLTNQFQRLSLNKFVLLGLCSSSLSSENCINPSRPHHPDCGIIMSKNSAKINNIRSPVLHELITLSMLSFVTSFGLSDLFQVSGSTFPITSQGETRLPSEVKTELLTDTLSRPSVFPTALPKIDPGQDAASFRVKTLQETLLVLDWLINH